MGDVKALAVPLPRGKQGIVPHKIVPRGGIGIAPHGIEVGVVAKEVGHVTADNAAHGIDVAKIDPGTDGVGLKIIKIKSRPHLQLKKKKKKKKFSWFYPPVKKKKKKKKKS